MGIPIKEFVRSTNSVLARTRNPFFTFLNVPILVLYFALSRLVGSAFFYINVSNFKGLMVTILRLYLIFKIFSISGINLLISHLTLNISIAELI
jgi:hypothetical protein